jgi:transcription elongation factor Elf1
MPLTIEQTQLLLRTSECPDCRKRALTAKLNCSIHDRECEIRVGCANCNAEFLVEANAARRRTSIVCDAATHMCRVTDGTAATR